MTDSQNFRRLKRNLKFLNDNMNTDVNIMLELVNRLKISQIKK